MVPFDATKSNFGDAFGVTENQMSTLLQSFEGQSFMNIAENILLNEEVSVAQKFLVFMDIGYQIGRQRLAAEVGLDLGQAFPTNVAVH